MIKRALFTLCGFVLLGAPACSDGEGPGGGAGEGPGTGPEVTGTGTKQPGEPCDETQECIPGSICFNEFCVGSGELRISLGFAVDSDYDLHVETPSGAEIYFANKTADGGTLDVDQCISSCGSGSHVENVVFEDDAPVGTYRVWVENFDGRAGGPFTIEVVGSADETFTGSLPASSDVSSDFTFTTSAGG